MERGMFWIVFQFVIYLTVAVEGRSAEKTMIKVEDIEKVIRKYSKECYPPKVDKEQFLALLIVALTTGRVANKPETRCFLFCVMKNFDIMNLPDAKVNIAVLNTTIANMTHLLIKEIITNNMELCIAAADSTDPCINALKYGRCFAKQGLFVFVRLEETHFPTTKLPKELKDGVSASTGKPNWWNMLTFPKRTTNAVLTTLPMNTTNTTVVTTVATVASTAAPAG